MNKKTDSKKYFWDEKVAKEFIGELNWLIVTNPLTIISMIASKGCGKTWPVLAYLIHLLEKDTKANAYLLRKFKHNASKNLTRSFSNVLISIKRAGITLKANYDTLQSEIKRITNKRDKNLNQIIPLSSFENLDSISGDAPSNGGRFVATMIDEILVPTDLYKEQPEFNEWKGQLDTIIDSLDRFGEEHDPDMKLFMTCNPWIAGHPEIKLLLRVIPEETWEMFIFGMLLVELLFNESLVNKLFNNKEFINRLLTNHTLTAEDKENNRLFVRRTKFSNPNNHWEKNKTKILNEIKRALIKGDKETLMKQVGIIHEPEVKNDMLVFDINLPYQHDESWFKENHWILKNISISWDIDRSRIFTMTPLMLYRKGNRTKFLLGEQIELTPIIDKDGSKHTLNGSLMFNSMQTYYSHIVKNSLIYNNEFPPIELVIDDNSKAYVDVIKTISTSLPILSVEPSVKQGEHSISNRQQISQQAYNSGLVVIHPNNHKLINDMNKCLKADINKPERKTTGRTNYLDRIDSAEYSFQVFWDYIKLCLGELQ